MAFARVANNLIKAGVGLAVAGAVVNSALYNGKLLLFSLLDSKCVTTLFHKISCVAVDGGQRAVIFDRLSGVSDKVRGEGTHFLIPVVQTPYIFDIRSRPTNVPLVTGSKGRYCCFFILLMFCSLSRFLFNDRFNCFYLF